MHRTFVESASFNVRRHFLPWDRPLLPQAVAWLAADWQGDGPLDLTSQLIIVPTRQAGRRLREALAAHAAVHEQAVFPPQVRMPEALLENGPATTGVTATRLEALLAWIEVFRTLDPGAFRVVFPVDPPGSNGERISRLARQFLHLQRSLAEGGLTMADVAEKAGADFPEVERWRQIAGIGEIHRRVLAARGLIDPQAAGLAAARAPVWPERVERIVVLGSPDPLPLALDVLAGLAQMGRVEVVVHAPDSEADAFDTWGRPLAATWAERVLALPEFAERVRVCANPAAQAKQLITLACGYDNPEGLLALGVADPEVLPLLENGLADAGCAVFNPEGRRREGDALHQLLSALAGLAHEGSFAAVATLARCPDFLAHLQVRLGSGFSVPRFLRELDELQAWHLPSSLADARRHAPQNGGLKVMAELRDALAVGTFPGSVAAVLAEIFAARHYDLANPAHARMAEAAAVWTGLLRECAGAAERFADAGLEPADWWDLAMHLYADDLRYDDKPPGALELQGWLELLWEDAPHLVVAGFNDGLVPDAVAGDPFLPEDLRVRLGLKTNAARFARDAYLLHALASGRAAVGRVDLLFGRTSSAGDPLRPSRLLLRCADADLPGRIRRLFREVEPERAASSWRRAWQLVPPRVEPPAKVSVTALRTWLLCPFRFYLRHGLHWESVDPAKTELDALDFGTLCHAALEAMGREPALRDCTDAGVLREFLLAELDRTATRRFGTGLPLPLVVQLESARQRLSRVAEVQAQTRGEGWVIERVEEKFLLEAGGLAISGKIDRIDRHADTGERRILDYKTSDRPVTPADAHLGTAHRGENPADFAWCEYAGRRRVWRDLQLPLYLRALAGEDGPVSCGYFNIPKAVGGTDIRLWTDHTPELAESAWRCAEGVAAAIRSSRFWPPNETLDPEHDDYAALFHHGVASSVAWDSGEGASG